MKKQFDLQYYMDHPDVRVVTRCGQSARIICTDAKSIEPDSYKIIGLISYDGCENEIIYRYKCDGSYLEGREHSSDLFFDLPDPIKKRVPLTFEDLMERIKTGKSMWVIRPKCAVLILGFHDANIKCAINFDSDRVRLYTYSDLMEWGEFADGDKTWKEIEE